FIIVKTISILLVLLILLVFLLKKRSYGDVEFGFGYSLSLENVSNGDVVLTHYGDVILGPNVMGVMNHEEHISGWIVEQAGGHRYFLLEKNGGAIRYYSTQMAL